MTVLAVTESVAMVTSVKVCVLGRMLEVAIVTVTMETDISSHYSNLVGDLSVTTIQLRGITLYRIPQQLHTSNTVKLDFATTSKLRSL